MKIYYVYKSYYDGDHDHGYWQSPFFLKRENAKSFFEKVKDKWWSETDGFYDKELCYPSINEVEVMEGSVDPGPEEDTWLNIIYT